MIILLICRADMIATTPAAPTGPFITTTPAATASVHNFLSRGMTSGAAGICILIKEGFAIETFYMHGHIPFLVMIIHGCHKENLLP
jgi:hypothetical protein